MGLKLILLGVLIAISAQGIYVPHDKKYAWYYYEEVIDWDYYYKYGKVKMCADDDECDGQRTCVDETCVGVARPPKNRNYYYDESITGGVCLDDVVPILEYFCDGNRYCSEYDECIGRAR